MKPKDKNNFGNWLSGFVDGEGCFYAPMITQHNKRKNIKGIAYVRDYEVPRVTFSIILRIDDEQILQKIKQFLQCGGIYYSYSNGIEAIQYSVIKHCDVALKIVPHFEKYPLRAKKRKDFETWKKIVMGIHNKKGGRYSRVEKIKLIRLMFQLKQNRKYIKE